MKKLIFALAVLLLVPVAVYAQMGPPGGGPYGPGMMMQQAKTPGDQALVQAMVPMHRGMQSMRLTGNTDKDFVAMMIPHHQSAVEMAQAELKYGTDPKIKAMAQAMLTAQQQEITEMKAWEAAQK